MSPEHDPTFKATDYEATPPLQCADCKTFVSVENESDLDALYGEPADTKEVPLCAECLAQRYEDI